MVIHDRSLKIIRAEFIHENCFPKKLDGVILVPFFIKHHPILKPTAAPLLDEDSKCFLRVFRFVRPDHTHLPRRVLGHRNDRFCQSLFTHLNRAKLLLLPGSVNLAKRIFAEILKFALGQATLSHLRYERSTCKNIHR